MGTNALSLALRTGRPSTVFSAEHLVEALHGWVCYCAPIHGPDGRILGVLDLSTTWDRSHPLAMSDRARSGLRHRGRTADRPSCPAAPPRGRPAPGAAACLGAEQVLRDGGPLRCVPGSWRS